MTLNLGDLKVVKLEKNMKKQGFDMTNSISKSDTDLEETWTFLVAFLRTTQLHKCHTNINFEGEKLKGFRTVFP